MPKKMRFQSWKDAEDAERRESVGRAVLDEALQAVILESVGPWIRSGKYRAAIIHPERSHGGIVIIQWLNGKLDRCATAYYAETWANDTLKITYDTQDGYDIADLARMVKRELNLVNERLKAEAGVK